MKKSIVEFLEESGLFKYVKSTKNNFVLWSDEFENEYKIPRKWGLTQARSWLSQIKAC